MSSVNFFSLTLNWDPAVPVVKDAWCKRHQAAKLDKTSKYSAQEKISASEPTGKNSAVQDILTFREIFKSVIFMEIQNFDEKILLIYSRSHSTERCVTFND